MFAVLFTTGGIGQKPGRSIRASKLLPIIDMHIHADTMEDFGGGELSICLGEGKMVLGAIDPRSPFELKELVDCEKKIKSSSSDAALK